MFSTSVSTYARAFNSGSSASEAAGDYKNTVATKVAQGIIGVLTLGIGYGVMKLIEKYSNVRPKIEEFCANAPNICEALINGVKDKQEQVKVSLMDGRTLTFTQNRDENTGAVSVTISDGAVQAEIEGTMAGICSKLEDDFYAAPGHYRITSEHQMIIERQTSRNTLKNSQDSVPSFQKFADVCTGAADAKAARSKAANDKFRANYEGAPSGKAAHGNKVRFDFPEGVNSEVNAQSKAGVSESAVELNRTGQYAENGRLAESQKLLRNAIGTLFQVEESEWPRRYASVGGFDTIVMKRLDYTDFLATAKEYAAQRSVSVVLDPEDDEAGQAQTFIDALCPDLANLSAFGAHGYGHSFADKDILQVYGFDVSDNLIVDSVAFKEVGKKSVVLQPATRACTATVTAMLIYDNGGEFSGDDMRNTNLDDNEGMKRNFRNAGFDSVTTFNSDLEALKMAIEAHGPAIVTVDSGIGGHVVIIDAVGDDKITLRDPAHGWMIDIKSSALKFGSECLHIGQKI